MFSLFVRRDGLIEPPELGTTDHHCHILPSIDDGPSNVEGSLAIAKLLYEMGVRHIVATPHVISDLYPNTTEQIVQKVNAFQEVLSEQGIPIRMTPGAEYYAEPALLAKVERDDLLCFGKERFVLFESPVEHPPALLEELIFTLKSAGYSPLLAHVERYHFIQNNLSYATELKRLGASFQVNHPSFMLPKTSHRGNLARWLHKKGYVDALGTDIHRATQPVQLQPKRAKPKMAKSVRTFLNL